MSTTKRLDRADIERRINEMFDALEGCPAEGLTEAQEQMDKIARRMRAAIDAQDRLDAAAPALLEVVREYLGGHDSTGPCECRTCETARAAIVLAGGLPPPGARCCGDLAAPPPADEPELNPFEGRTDEALLRALRLIREIGLLFLDRFYAKVGLAAEHERHAAAEISRIALIAGRAVDRATNAE